MYIHGEGVITKQTIINYDPQKNILVYTPIFIFHSPYFLLQRIILTKIIEYGLSNPHEVFVVTSLFSAWFVLTLARVITRTWTCILLQ